MWLVIGAASAWALPFGFGVSGLLDLPGAAPGGGTQARYPARFGEPLAGDDVGCADVGAATAGVPDFDELDFDELDFDKIVSGCDGPTKDAKLGPTVGLVVPVYVPLAPNAALRVEARASYTQGRVRAQCTAEGGCGFEADDLDFPLQSGQYGSAVAYLPSLTLAAGPDVRLSTGDGVAPHLSAVVGAGAMGPFLDTDWFDERRSLAFTAVASAAIGLTTQPGASGWFVDLGYSSQLVSGSKVSKPTDETVGEDLRLQPFLVNGVRLDAGLLFGASN